MLLIAPYTRFHSPILLHHQTVAQLDDKTKINNKLKITKMKKLIRTKTENESAKINSLNISVMEETSINFNGVKVSEATSDQLAYERFCEFCKKGYYIYAEPKSFGNEKPYFEIVASKGNDKEEFSLNVNREVLHTVISYLTLGNLNDISKTNQNFNIRFNDFKSELFQAERAQGKAMRKAYTATAGTVISSHYKHGVIFYRPSHYDFMKKMSAI